MKNNSNSITLAARANVCATFGLSRSAAIRELVLAGATLLDANALVGTASEWEARRVSDSEWEAIRNA